MQPVAELPSGPIRGLYETSISRVFAVTSTTLFEIFQGFTFLSRGTVPNGTSYVSMCDNGAFLILSVEGAGLVYNLSTNVLTTIAPEDPALTFGRVAYIDGYIVTNQPETIRFWYKQSA